MTTTQKDYGLDAKTYAEVLGQIIPETLSPDDVKQLLTTYEQRHPEVKEWRLSIEGQLKRRREEQKP